MAKEKLIAVNGINDNGVPFAPTVIQVQYGEGLAGIQLLGHCGDVVRDGKERALTAIDSCFDLKRSFKRILINFLPANVKKTGSQLDLPMAIGIYYLIAKKSPRVPLEETVFIAELGLDGQLIPVRSQLAMIIQLWQAGAKRIVVPASIMDLIAELFTAEYSSENDEISILDSIFGFANLRDVCSWLGSGLYQPPQSRGDRFKGKNTKFRAVMGADFAGVSHELSIGDGGESKVDDFQDLDLSPKVVRSIVAAVAGHHHLLLRGSPGIGKTMIAQRIPGIFPLLSQREVLESFHLHSLTQSTQLGCIIEGAAPQRAPHHSSSTEGLIGSLFQPGEISLAHNGILFLDELPEFNRRLLESLREPLETGHITIARSKAKVVWPASVLLIAACNNCPCGWFASQRKNCRCSSQALISYLNRISGPLMDRIDIHLNLPEPANSINTEAAANHNPKFSSQALRNMVNACLAFGRKRAGKKYCQAGKLSIQRLNEQFGGFESMASRFKVRGAKQSYFSKRSMAKILKVARTLADMDESIEVTDKHVEEAKAFGHEAAALERGEDNYGLV